MSKPTFLLHINGDKFIIYSHDETNRTYSCFPVGQELVIDHLQTVHYDDVLRLFDEKQEMLDFIKKSETPVINKDLQEIILDTDQMKVGFTTTESSTDLIVETPTNIRIRTQDQLVDIMHQLANSKIDCKVFGESFELADRFPNLLPNGTLEMYAVLFKDTDKFAEVNLALLFNWAATKPAPVYQEHVTLQAEDCDFFGESEFLEWLSETYPTSSKNHFSFFLADKFPATLPTGYIMFKQLENFYTLCIPSAIKPEHHLIKINFSEARDGHMNRMICIDLLGNNEIYEIMDNVEELLNELADEIKSMLKTEPLHKIHTQFNDTLDMGTAGNILADAIENCPHSVDWGNVFETIGLDLNEVASEYISSVVGNHPMHIGRGSGARLDDVDLLTAAEEYFQVDVDELISNALNNVEASGMLDLADRLNINIPERNRKAMEREMTNPS